MLSWYKIQIKMVKSSSVSSASFCQGISCFPGYTPGFFIHKNTVQCLQFPENIVLSFEPPKVAMNGYDEYFLGLENR